MATATMPQQMASVQLAPTAYPRKLFYRIHEVAEITGLKPYVLRYWETEFRELAPEKDKNDQRRYRQQDIEMVLKIKDLLYARKFTIAGARQQIRAERGGRAKRVSEGTRLTALKDIRAELFDLMSQLSV